MQRRLQLPDFHRRFQAHRHSPVLAFACAVLEPRPLRSTGITRFHRYYGPLRHPVRPGLALAGCRFSPTLRVRRGFPCYGQFPLACMPTPLPRWDPPAARRSSWQKRLRPSPYLRRVGSHITLFEACSAFTHVSACMLAEPPMRPVSIRGFDGFVTSAAAPTATGRSDPLPGGIRTH